MTLWDVVSGRPKARWQGVSQGRIDAVMSLAFAPEDRPGTILAGGGTDRIVRLWDTPTMKERGALRGHPHHVQALAFSADGQLLASADRAGVVKVWDATKQTERAVLETGGDEAVALAFAPDGRMLAVAVDQAVQLWDVAQGRLVTVLHGHAGKVRCLAFSPDGRSLASGSSDRTVRLWDVAGFSPTRP